MLNPISVAIAASMLAAYAAALWILFERAGERGWKALVPVYGDLVRMRLTWSRDAFVRRLALSCVLALSLLALWRLGALAVTVDGWDSSVSVVTPFTLRQGVAGLCACVSLVWLLVTEIEAHWYAADAYDGTVGTFLLLAFLGGWAYLGMALLALRGKRGYLGTLEERDAMEAAERVSYAR